MKKEKISIVLPVYNSQNTIARTIDSVIKQTYDNYELIIINDGSIDNSESICLEYADKYKKIKYIKIENKGVSNARNLGIDNATGNYVMFIDSDDEYYKNTLETVYKYIEQRNDLIIFGYNRIHVSKNKTKEMNTNVTYLKDGKEKNIFIEKMQREYLFNQIWNKVYKTKILKDNNIKFDTKIASGEDYRFNLKYIDCINDAIYIDKVLYNYYSTDNGLSLKTGPDKLYIKIENLKQQKLLYIKYGYDIKYIDDNYIYTCFSGLTAMVEKQSFKKKREYIKKYVQNQEIREELISIKQRHKGIKIKIYINFLLIKKIFLLCTFAEILIFIRKIYRRIRLE